MEFQSTAIGNGRNIRFGAGVSMVIPHGTLEELDRGSGKDAFKNSGKK